jgi:pimeloyl-ACP methyl ester carboxylesterase
LINKKDFLNKSHLLTFHGSFNKKDDKANILLLLPKTRGPFGVTKFKKLIEKKFNLLEYDDVQSEQSRNFDQFDAITFEDKALAIKNVLKKWKNIKYHIICHSTGCGIGTFLGKNDKENCKSLILINPWNKIDDDFRSLQKKRIENAKKIDRISYLKTEYELLYSNNYIERFKEEFCNYINKQKNIYIDVTSISKRLHNILNCNIGNEICKLELPKLLINAVDDKLMKIHHGKELHKLCYNSNLISLDSGGHMLTETRADDLNTHINYFIDAQGK